MRNVLAIADRELRSMFVSPIAYVVLTGFLLLGGWFFYNMLVYFLQIVGNLQFYAAMGNPNVGEQVNLNDLVIAPLLSNLSIVLVIIIPMVTMRSFAEEKRAGTYELLMTSPLAVWEIVCGKFLATVAFVSLMVGMTAIFPLILMVYGDPEVGVIIAGYLGLFLLAVSFASIGLFTSSLTENQIIAAVSCLVILLLLYVISWPADGNSVLSAVLKYLSFTEHFGEMLKGVIDTRDLAYFSSVIALSLFLTHRSVESIRWR